jgi:hypothetical protein
MEDSDAVRVIERNNNAGLKKPSQVLCEETSDSSAVLNAILKCKEHFSYFDSD